MRKKYLIMTSLSLLTFVVVLFSGCGRIETQEENTVPSVNIESVKNICEISTLDVKMDNIIRGTQNRKKGITHLFEKDRDYYITYKTEAKVYYDLSKVDMKQNGTNITITLPEPEVECHYVAGTQKSALETDSKINKNEIDGDKINDMMDDEDKTLAEELKQNSSLMNSAEKQAQDLITNHINQLGNAAGVTYNITFVQKTE